MHICPTSTQAQGGLGGDDDGGLGAARSPASVLRYDQGFTQRDDLLHTSPTLFEVWDEKTLHLYV